MKKAGLRCFGQRTKAKRIVPKTVLFLAILVASATGWWLLDLGQIGWLVSIQQMQLQFSELFQLHPLSVVCAFFCIFTICAALAIPGASILMLIAGASFGLFWGTALSLLASTTGATLSMLAARHFLRAPVERRVGKQLAGINAGLARDGALYLFTLRMAPLIPFLVLNPALGLTQLKTWTYFWVSALGMLAGTAVYVNAGRELALLTSPADILSPSLIAALALIGLLPLVASKLSRSLRPTLATKANNS
jgi:uncharacterized membrane protein YdjX (TVP38/TMEM64 family)